MLQKALQDDTLSQTKIFEKHKLFKGRENLLHLML